MYVAQTSFDNGHTWYDGVANWGNAPTFARDKKLLEIHLFNFSKNVYNHYVKVRLIKFIRASERFENAKKLKEAISFDKNTAEKYFLEQKIK